MTIPQAVTAIITSGSVAAFSYYMHTRPHDKLKPRMVPWVIIAIGATAFFFMLIVHLANLLGFESGRGR